MAEIFVSPIVGTIIESLKSAATAEIKLLGGVEDEIEKLESTLRAIQGVLKDAEEKQWKSHAIKDWLMKLDEVAYDAGDIVDEFATEVKQARLRGEIVAVAERKQVRNILCCFSGLQKVKFRHQIGNEIKGIWERLNKISQERLALGLVVLPMEVGPNPVIEQRETGSFVDESDVVGREVNVAKIVNLLKEDGSMGSNFSVIPIVGMGGLGKTTLAQLVYKEVSVHFDVEVWVSVPDAMDEMTLIKAIIRASETRESCEGLPLERLQGKLLNILTGKKFILVLDDVWSENPMGWDKLCGLFRAGGKGSKILVTTRSEVVASITGTVPTHNLDILSEDDSWMLFKKKAFENENMDTYPHLERIGKEIVKKCNGLPLALRTLGCLLKFTKSRVGWEKILRSEIWDLKDSPVLPALKLSYLHLSTDLKQCFAYCSIFPKGHGLKKDKLVKLWMAQQYVKDSEVVDMEGMGCEYFDQLVMRSIFLYSCDDYVDDEHIYKMHDLTHDLAKFVSRELCCKVEEGESSTIPDKTRHVFFDRRNGTLNEESYNFKGLHSLFLPPYHRDFYYEETLHNCRRLRVLSLFECNITELPKSIGDLKHLRYLDPSQNRQLSKLPDSICSLLNLQTLKIDLCLELSKLPKDTKTLVNLRHLYCKYCKLIYMPPGLGGLTQLRSLSKFVVGKEDGGKIAELKELKYLKGGIKISKLNNVMSGEEAKEAHLKNKECLEKLRLKWDKYDRNNSPRDRNVDKEVIEGLQPHYDLKELHIKYCEGVSLPSWLQLLTNLEYIELKNLRNCQTLPPLGILPKLKCLEIDNLGGLQHLSSEFCVYDDNNSANDKVAFPSLKYLGLKKLRSWEEWSGLKRGDLPCLSELSLVDCDKLKALPSQLPSSLMALVIDGCPSLITELRFTSLENLELKNSAEMLLDSVPHLTSLSYLSLGYFNKWTTSLTPLASLERLTISHVKEVAKVGLPPTLKFLIIESCDELKSLSEVHLPLSLRTLLIDECRMLVSLPAHLNMLPSLERLQLYKCPRLASLPELPSGLKFLAIFHCPMLYRRCQEETGEDWPKIASIPNKYIYS